MAKETVNDQHATDEDHTPVMQKFRWGMPSIYDHRHTMPMDNFARFSDTVRDVTSGIATTLEILGRDEIASESTNMQVMLRPIDAGNLQRLSIAALNLLNEEAARLQNWAFEYHTPEGKAERMRAKR